MILKYRLRTHLFTTVINSSLALSFCSAVQLQHISMEDSAAAHKTRTVYIYKKTPQKKRRMTSTVTRFECNWKYLSTLEKRLRAPRSAYCRNCTCPLVDYIKNLHWPHLHCCRRFVSLHLFNLFVVVLLSRLLTCCLMVWHCSHVTLEQFHKSYYNEGKHNQLFWNLL